MAVAHDQATMELIKTRLSHSERPLIRLIRTFYKLSSTTTNKNNEEEIKIIHMTFLIELKYLIKTLNEIKGKKTKNLNEFELNELNLEKINLEKFKFEEKFKINQLELQLDQVRKQRKNKILYEEIGKEVRRFSDRFQSADRINGLAREIEVLLEEQGFYAERWASRRAQFDTVISNLEVLQESIKEEKADADRKKALNDDESDDGNIAEEATTEGLIKVTTVEGNEGGAESSEMIIKDSNTGGGILNPNAPSFLPIRTEGAAPQPQQTQSSEVTTPDERMKIDSTIDNTTSNLNLNNHLHTNGSSYSSDQVLDLDKSDRLMKIDGVETRISLDTNDDNRNDGLELVESTMEDGEEVEEVEEGEEMEIPN